MNWREISQRLWNHQGKAEWLMQVGLVLHCLAIFIPMFAIPGRIGLGLAFILVWQNGRWRSASSCLKHPLFGLELLLVCWLLATTLWSLDQRVTLESMWGVFKDILFVTLPLLYVLKEPARRTSFALMLAWAGVVVVGMNGAQYVSELLTDPKVILNIKVHRGWGHPLIFFAPFTLMQARQRNDRWSVFWYCVIVIEIAMIIATGARGAWAALAVLLGLWLAFGADRRQIRLLLLAAMLVGAVGYFVLPDQLLRDRVAKGIDTSFRTTGTWGPALQMMDERPWKGFGFGKEIFNREFNRRSPTEESWTIKVSKGPHNIYLEAGFAGGYPALIALLVLALVTQYYGLISVSRQSTKPDRLFALACVASFTSFYLVRGMFESVKWGPLLVLIVMIAYFSRSALSKRVDDLKPQ